MTFADRLRQVTAGELSVGYVDEGPANGKVVILLHGWPYDIHTYAEATPRLAAAGHRVIGPAHSCSAALEAIFNTKPDLAFVDTRLGSETCEAVLDELRAQGVPVVICSGHATDALPEFALPYSHLAKPFNDSEIAIAIAQGALDQT